VIVEADVEGVQVLVGVGAGCKRLRRREVEVDRVASEIDVIVLGPERPVLGEGDLGAAADGPAPPGGRRLVPPVKRRIRIGVVAGSLLLMRPGEAALGIEQGVVERVAEAAGEGAEGVDRGLAEVLLRWPARAAAAKITSCQN
jgi:hypothetical protein